VARRPQALPPRPVGRLRARRARAPVRPRARRLTIEGGAPRRVAGQRQSARHFSPTGQRIGARSSCGARLFSGRAACSVRRAMTRETAAVKLGERWAERGAKSMRTRPTEWPLRWPHGLDNARSLVEPMVDDKSGDLRTVARLAESC